MTTILIKEYDKNCDCKICKEIKKLLKYLDFNAKNWKIPPTYFYEEVE